ncbi:helix-turn-helix domain-containing protein [Borborobacter arsenicus]|nr:helix-turn-helix domain-containing protein [Pseudaminobacter arsenicus]
MSWKASAWAKEQRLGSPAAKSILLCLADYADPDKAECWPSQTLLASDAEVSERTAREWLQRLEEWGLIQRTRRTRSSGARASDMIVLNLDVMVRDGADRCREIKAGEGDDGENLPANSAGRSNRQPDAEPTGNQTHPTGNQCRAYKEEPSIEPPTGTSQSARQGARESAEDGSMEENPKAVERAFERAYRQWPTSIGDSRPEALKAWFALSPDEREEAALEWERYVAACKASGRKLICAYSKYLSEKRWTGLPPREVEAKPVVLEAAPFGPLWQAARLKQLVTGPKVMLAGLTRFEQQLVDDGKATAEALFRDKQRKSGWPQINAMHDRASMRQGVTVSTALEPLAALMVAVPVGSETFEAWRLEHELRGWPWIPDPGRQPVVYFPAGGPEGLSDFEAAVRGQHEHDDRQEAAE